MISLEKNIRTCKVDTGWADRNQSDRFQDPNLMLCATWNRMDNTGRLVCANSFYTKTPGCNSALDRVAVENTVSRPQYFEYFGINAAGVKGPMLTDPVGVPVTENYENYNSAAVNANVGYADMMHNYQYAGSWNGNLHGTTIGTCPQSAYAQGMREIAGEQRQAAMAQQNANQVNMQHHSGMA